jgi:lauroyl/myristoyl acyltransferase
MIFAADRERQFLARHRKQLSENDRFYRDVAFGKYAAGDFPGSETIGRCLETPAKLKRPILFVSAHWGNYLHAFLTIAMGLPAGSRFFTIRGEAWNDLEDQFWQRVNSLSESRIAVHRSANVYSLRGAFQTLRQGGYGMILYDLYDDYGRTNAYSLLGHTVDMTYGWTKLAHRTRSLVIVVEPASVRRRDIRFSDVVEPNGMAAEEFTDACMKACLRSLGRLIAEEPAHWLMWKRLDRFIGDVRANAVPA